MLYTFISLFARTQFTSFLLNLYQAPHLKRNGGQSESVVNSWTNWEGKSKPIKRWIFQMYRVVRRRGIRILGEQDSSSFDVSFS